MRVLAPERATWRVFGILMAGAFVGVIGILPYALTLLDRLPSSMATTLPSRWVLHPLQVGQSTVLIGAATALGLWPDPKVGLDAPLLQRLVFAPRLAVAGGKTLDDLQNTGLAGPAGLVLRCDPEESPLRLGLMTLLVWVGARLTGTAVPRPLVVWAAIAITALLFGAGDLPTAAALLPLSPLVIARALLFNGLGGMVFGWLYWKRSLVAAMIAHFSADIVLHVLVPVIMQSLMGSVGLRHDQTLGRASPTSARANRQR